MLVTDGSRILSQMKHECREIDRQEKYTTVQSALQVRSNLLGAAT